eukprot:TRINITY_DN10852_c0_g2_i2.p1 TRINITY_DN10852_c0_g2~~TRINITY_DN10852_c0_g2_i2.p1  ORF type:complete len:217 (+),score=41.28 TRINITY_DN10852_c0_g2_i2:147-797(+)
MATTTVDFDDIIKDNELVVFIFFRGAWCPWCRAYLQDVNINLLPTLKKLKGKVYAISSESDAVTATIAENFKIDFPVVNDTSTAFARRFDIKVTPKGSIRADDPYAHPDGIIQPAVVMYHKGEKFFVWRSEPSKSNISGAKDRVMPRDLVRVLEARSKGEDVKAIQLHTFGGEELKQYEDSYRKATVYYAQHMPEALLLLEQDTPYFPAGECWFCA